MLVLVPFTGRNQLTIPTTIETLLLCIQVRVHKRNLEQFGNDLYIETWCVSNLTSHVPYRSNIGFSVFKSF